MKKIPYINLKDQHVRLKNELMEAIGGVLDGADFILGKEVRVFEEKIAEYCGTRYAVGVNSGTDALFLTLKAYGIGPGDEVITAPNSFLASASVIAASGARPVFVDIREDLNINPDLIEEKLTKKTRAIIPVHLTGKPADMSSIDKIAKDHGLKVIEDAAQAIGAIYRSKRTGSLGDAGCFSLHPLKTLNACGDGGAITTDNEQLYKTLIQLRNIGLKNRDESDQWGYNSRLDSIQACILNVKFKYIDQWTEARRENAAFYIKELKGVVGVPQDENYEKQVYHTFVIKAERRDDLQQHLLKNGIETKIHYPIPIHLQGAASNLGYKRGSFPACEKAAKMILSLPIYQGLDKEDLGYIADAIKDYYK
jgi:dTDP-4-amino-4,6-dideoxygalactose transaminase